MVDRDVPCSGAPSGSMDSRAGGAPSSNLDTLSHHSRSPRSTSAPETSSSQHAPHGHMTGTSGHMTTVESSAAMAAMTSMALTASHTSMAGVGGINATSPFMLMDHRLRLPPGDDMKCHVCGVSIFILTWVKKEEWLSNSVCNSRHQQTTLTAKPV